MPLRSTTQYLRRSVSLAVLAAIGTLFVVLSCHGGSLQFSAAQGFHLPSQSCEEHTLDSVTPHAEKSIFSMATREDGKFFPVVVLVVAFFLLAARPHDPHKHSVKMALASNQQKRWVWSKNLPFSSLSFFPYFAAQRDP